MTPADERVLQLLKKWQTSLELHGRYAALPDDQYWLVQPWPRHERPTRWVIDLARQRLTDLQQIVQTRLATGDQSLSEALEMMTFLTNLVGSQHVERFVPLAEPEQERQLASPAAPKSTGTTSTSTMLRPGAPPPRATPTRTRAASKTAKATNDTTVTAVIKDAQRLLSWGREWHELPEAIARIAGRPDAAQVRQILRARRAAIEPPPDDASTD